MYACIHICLYVCLYVCMCVCMYVYNIFVYYVQYLFIVYTCKGIAVPMYRESKKMLPCCLLRIAYYLSPLAFPRCHQQVTESLKHMLHEAAHHIEHQRIAATGPKSTRNDLGEIDAAQNFAEPCSN